MHPRRGGLIHAAGLRFAPVAGWPKLPPGREKIGDMHGDVAVASNGEVYVSVQDPQAGLQGVVATDLLLPAAITISGEYAIVGELKGRVTVLDKAGRVVSHPGACTGPGTGTNQVKAEDWRPGIVTAPHASPSTGGAIYSSSEFNAFGRVQRFDRQ